MSNWSSRIRAERERQNLTREQVVQRMLQFLPDSEKAVTTRTLMAWEAGEREPRVTVGLALALALGVEDMTDLYLDSEPKLNRTGQQRLGEYRSMLLHTAEFVERQEHTLRLLPSRLRIFALLSSSLIVKLMSGMDHIWLYTLPQRHVPSS